MWGYQRRLARDLERWSKAGWVSAEAADMIRADVARTPGLSLPGVLAMLASVLLGFAVMSFVAAHWEEIPRLARLGLLFALLWTGYLAAASFEARNMRIFRDAAIVAALAVFGAAIMLISQMFHIDGNPPDGILMWWIGALGAGVILRSNPALAFAMVLVCVWSGVWMSDRSGTHWPFLIGWALVTAAFAWQRWWPGAHLSALALAGFVVSLGYTLTQGHAHVVPVVVGLSCALLAAAVEKRHDVISDAARIVIVYASAAAFAGLFALQFIEHTSTRELAGLAAATLLLLLTLIWHGLESRNRGALWLGYVAFSIEIFALYVKTVGTLLDTSLFFLIAGLILAGLAAFAWRLHKRQLHEVTP